MAEKKLVTKNQLGKALGVTPTIIMRYHTVDGMPAEHIPSGLPGPTNRYLFDEAKCIAWYAENITPLKEEEGGMNAAKLRKMQAEASLAELELQRERGELIEIAEVAKMVASEYTNIRAKLLSMPSALAGLVEQCTNLREITAVIDNYVRDVLIELSADKKGKK